MAAEARRRTARSVGLLLAWRATLLATLLLAWLGAANISPKTSFTVSPYWTQLLEDAAAQQQRLESAAKASAAQGLANQPYAGLPCAPGCQKRGNCNIEDGRCECPFGWSGPACDQPLLGACMTAPTGALAQCGGKVLKNCRCWVQCHRLLCKGGHFHSCEAGLPSRRCFMLEGLPEHRQSSNLPGDVQGVAAWLQHWGMAEAPTSLQGSSNSSSTSGNRLMAARGLLKGRHRAVGSSHDAAANAAAKALLQRLNITWRWYTMTGDRDPWQAVPVSPGSPAVYSREAPTQALALNRCPSRCHDHGFCQGSSDAPTCVCHRGFEGPTCGRAAPHHCWNACNGRGACLGGFCHCQPGWFGLDCSRRTAYRPHAGPGLAPASRLSIYVYELPTSVAWAGEIDDGSWGVDSIYTAYQHFARLLLSDWAVRTDNPWAANLFYVPAFTYAYAGNAGQVANIRATAHVHSVVRYISTAYPFWNRTRGRDHLFWLPSDRGACHLPAHLRAPIYITHWGFSQRAQSTFWDLPNREWGCHLDSKDVVAAPVWLDPATGNWSAATGTPHTSLEQHYASVMAADGADPARTLLLFFAGDSRADPSYSGGVRQAIATYMAALPQPPPSDVIYLARNGTPEYRRLLAKSIFCLAPYGFGWGIRMSISMLTGCIPLIVQDAVHQPFDDVLPYPEFSVRLAKADIPHLLDILRRISPAEVAELRRGMARHYRYFIWPPEQGGLAYNATLRSLRRRRSLLRAGLQGSTVSMQTTAE